MADIKITPTTLSGNNSAKLSSAQLTIQQGRIVATPPALSNVPHTISLKGEVTQQNSDGTVRIETPRGTIEVKLDTPPAKGQKVDIQIPSGQPPRDITVQAQAPRPTPQNTQQAQPQQPTQATPAQTAHIKPEQPVQQTPQQGQPQQPQTPQQPSQPAPQVQQPDPSQIINTVKQLQTTAKQAIETLAQTARSLGTQAPNTDNTQNVNTQNIVTASPKPLAIGQAIRLTPLPTAMQNLTALSQLSTGTSNTQNTINSILQTPVTLPTVASQNANAQTAPLLQTSSLTIASPTIAPQTSVLQAPVNGQAPQTLIQPNIGQSINPLPSAQTPPALPNGLSVLNTPALSTLSLGTPTTAIPQDGRILSIQQPILNASQPTGEQQNYTISAIMKSGTLSPNTANITPTQIMAQVTGMVTPQGNPVVELMPQMAGQPPLLMALNYPATNLTKGTILVMQPTPSTVSQTPPHSAQSWPVMTEAFEEVLAQLQPAQAQALMNVIPRPAATGHQFTAAALLFIAAARGGDISGWMGNRADNILRNAEGGKKDILNRLLSDLSTMTGRSVSSDAQTQASSGSADWRGYTIPLLFGMDLSKINIWTTPFGDDNADGGADEKTKGTRFIVDLELSRMGSLQLDGLVQPYAKRLDLALKSHHDFSPHMRQELRTLWHSALQSIDMSGHIEFQTY